MLPKLGGIKAFERRVLLIVSQACDRVARLCRQFAQEGWSTATATSGPEAVRMLSWLKPDLVVLDASLDPESGWLTCAKLKLGRPNLEIMLAAEHASPQLRRFTAYVGGRAILPWPDVRPEIVEAVRQERFLPTTSL